MTTHRARACLLGALAITASRTAIAAPPKKAAAPAPAPAVAPVAPTPMPAATAADDEGQSRLADARAAFERGLQLFEKGSFDAALSEFVRSRDVVVTRSATKYAASCLRSLQRWDEALTMFEEVLALANLSDADRAFAQKGVSETREHVGEVSVTGGEPGMIVLVDGRLRGTLPLAKPLRLNAGSHDVGAFKEGRDPFGVLVEVVGGKAAAATLESRSLGGRLKVSEQAQRVLDVVVDGVVVGKTPWEGSLAVGDHQVVLRGAVPRSECAIPTGGAPMSDAATIEMGSAPVRIPVRLRELTTLNLRAEELEAELRVDPVPAGALVSIDSVEVGRGAWEGHLHGGEHKIEVSSEGFMPVTQRVKLARGKHSSVRVELQRDPYTPEWTASRNRWLGLAFGVGGAGLATFGVSGVLALSTAGDIRSACSNGYCPPSQADNFTAMHTYSAVATASLIAGAVGVGSGIAILLAAKPKGAAEKRPDSGVTITAGVGGVAGTF